MPADLGFHPKEHYGLVSAHPYRLLPFRFMRWQTGEVLVVNDVGEHLFLDASSFDAFVRHRLDSGSDTYLDCKAKHLLADSDSTVPIDLLATKYRTKKSFLEGFTKLHLFVVTLRCDHSCHYCQVSRVTEDRERFDMSRETAERAVNLMFRSPARDLKVEFQGGEPLLNFQLIRYLVNYANECNTQEGRRLEFVIATNLSPLTDEMLVFMREHSIFISTSLDGPEAVHNANRPRRGNDSYEITLRNIGRAREALGHDRVSAIMTTTERSLLHPREIIDEYVRQDFDSIFLRPISPYGFAIRTRKAWEYGAQEFIEFYKAALDHVINLNRNGVAFMEVYAQILLRRMLTPFPTGYMDLQSPAGAGVGVVAYNYDGDVYASDEARMLAEMGDFSFRLGNVHEQTYEEIFGGSVLQALQEASCVEALPGCSECAFVPYCGADPIFHWATQGDPVGNRPTSAFCTKNMALLKHLFGLLHSGDAFIEKLFLQWATSQDLPHRLAS
ncbi:MAG TPA: His-Xaa-Ser system radical SAM maturase HxsB [Candidatus Polarisedimenticolia bacterium]|jgi:His-Xaa-Ser system radical SAM maturase HxsB|nr:His-Xaa-Ser system radical SAM maturase HxsB [Candidatus Polarisedimenticolia bacterium]